MVRKVLELENIEYSHDDGHQIFSNFNLTINDGETVGIVGSNGTGKTTMFLLSTGIYQPKKGQIRLLGKKVSPRKFNPSIGMVFQNQDDQLFSPSVYEDIAFGLLNMGFDNVAVEKKASKIMDRLNISHLKNKQPHHLSGGEKRLVAIAGVLVMEPEFIIWDEPTSNLDMRYRRRLIDIIKDSQQSAMMIASHDLEFILEVCNRVILLDNGQIILDGPPKKVLRNELVLSQHGIEIPFSLKQFN